MKSMYNNKISIRFKEICSLCQSKLYLAFIIGFMVSSIIDVVMSFIGIASVSEFFKNLFSQIIGIALVTFIIWNLWVIREKSSYEDYSLLDNFRIIKVVLMITLVIGIISSILSISGMNSILSIIQNSKYIQDGIVEANLSLESFERLIGFYNFASVMLIISSIFMVLVMFQGEKALNTLDYEGNLYSFNIYSFISILQIIISIILYCQLVYDPDFIKMYEMTGVKLSIGVVDIISYCVSLVSTFIGCILLSKLRNILLIKEN